MDLIVCSGVHCKVVLGFIIEESLRSYGKAENETGNMFLPIGVWEGHTKRQCLNWSRQAKRPWKTEER